MIRHCDGTDIHLTRAVPEDEVGDRIVSPWPVDRTRPGYVNVACDCGKEFDDVDFTVIYPHAPVWDDMTVVVAEMTNEDLDIFADSVPGDCIHPPGMGKRPTECIVCQARGERARRRDGR